MNRSCRRVVRRLVAAVLASVVLFTGTEAWAAFDSSQSAGHSLSTAVLAPPTNPAASTTSCLLGLTATATVTWTASTSTWADGYEVLTSSISGGPYTVARTVSGASTTSAQITSLSLATTTYIVVRATKQAWRSAATAQIAYKSPSLLCL